MAAWPSSVNRSRSSRRHPLQELVDQVDETHPEHLERLVPLPVPVRVRDEVDDGALGHAAASPPMSTPSRAARRQRPRAGRSRCRRGPRAGRRPAAVPATTSAWKASSSSSKASTVDVQTTSSRPSAALEVSRRTVGRWSRYGEGNASSIVAGFVDRPAPPRGTPGSRAGSASGWRTAHPPAADRSARPTAARPRRARPSTRVDADRVAAEGPDEGELVDDAPEQDVRCRGDPAARAAASPSATVRRRSVASARVVARSSPGCPSAAAAGGRARAAPRGSDAGRVTSIARGRPKLTIARRARAPARPPGRTASCSRPAAAARRRPPVERSIASASASVQASGFSAKTGRPAIEARHDRLAVRARGEDDQRVESRRPQPRSSDVPDRRSGGTPYRSPIAAVRPGDRSATAEIENASRSRSMSGR